MPFNLLKKRTPGPQALPVRRRELFLSPSEVAFYKLLQEMAAPLVVCPRVPLSALCYIVQPRRHEQAAEYVRSGRLDFLLCLPKQMVPYLVVELLEPGREGRDELLEQVCALAGLPLLWVEASEPFDADALKALIRNKLRGTPLPPADRPPEALRPQSPPACPICGRPMVLRTGGRGAPPGRVHYACPDAPKCPGELPYSPPVSTSSSNDPHS